MSKPFAKPALSHSDQLALLKRRGMLVADDAMALHYLGHISYYRLRAYWMPFEIPAAAGDHAFRLGTRFEDVLALYVFDRHLRLLVLDAIERIEVSIRATWSHHIAMQYGPHGYLKPSLYRQPEQYQKIVSQLDDEISRSQDTFIKHYRTAYAGPKYPPVWMAAELISLGQLSKLVDFLKLREDRSAIARPHGLDEKIFLSLLHHLTYIRNVCAHHGRLWNKQLTVTMIAPKYPADVSEAVRDAHPRRLHNTLVMLGHLLPKIAPGTHWKAELLKLLASTPVADPVEMGFPVDWQRRNFWKTHPDQGV